MRKKALWALLLLGGGWLSFDIYRAIYPDEAFYREEFEKVAGKKVPARARFVFRSASYPDIHGDYTSCALFIVDEADNRRLTRDLETLRPRTAHRPGSSCWWEMNEAHGGPLEYSRQSTACHEGGCRHWGLLNDGRPVVFELSSW